MMSRQLEGRRILVTGGSRGIGSAVVRACTEEGAEVGFTFRESIDAARKLSEGTGALPLRADASDLSQMTSAVELFTGGAGDGGKDIDGLVINAGVYRRTSFPDLSSEGWDRTMDCNLKGAFNSVKSALPYMREGSMVFISSQLAFRGTPHGADYAASKAGMLGLARSLALELAPAIRVNSIAPGYVDTDLLSSDTPQKRRQREEEVPLKRVAPPSEIAGPVVFLLSGSSSYITGATIDVNGGLFIH